MARLSHLLPPFASDYSGACSALFSADCVIVIVDAACCSRSYTRYEETRWDDKRHGSISTRLRQIEVVTGDDSRIIDQSCDIIEKMQPSLFALVGTPVPALVGLDLEGMASLIERRTGVPSIGIPTSGFETYEKGMRRTLTTLVRKFSAAADATPSPRAGHDRLRVNVFGTSPLDVGAFEEGALASLLGERGCEVICDMPDHYGIGSLAQAGTADATLVTTVSGLNAARELQQRCGVPYVAAFPIGITGLERALNQLMACAGRGEEPPEGQGRSRTARVSGMPLDGNASPDVLIMGDKVIANSIRAALRTLGYEGVMAVGTFFSSEAALARPCDVSFKGEEDLLPWLRAHRNTAVIADPLVERVTRIEGRKVIPYPQPSISSHLYHDATRSPFGKSGQSWLEETLACIATPAG
jgi:nitrogenase molybdenum-cofactor synthesis protein NifE